MQLLGLTKLKAIVQVNNWRVEIWEGVDVEVLSLRLEFLFFSLEVKLVLF